jgi:hypothetical protein
MKEEQLRELDKQLDMLLWKIPDEVLDMKAVDVKRVRVPRFFRLV